MAFPTILLHLLFSAAEIYAPKIKDSQNLLQNKYYWKQVVYLFIFLQANRMFAEYWTYLCYIKSRFTFLLCAYLFIGCDFCWNVDKFISFKNNKSTTLETFLTICSHKDHMHIPHLSHHKRRWKSNINLEGAAIVT